MTVPYVHSGYERIKDDNYQTIDKRCIYGLLEWFPNLGTVIDPCADNGSAIISTLQELGYDALGWEDALSDWDFKTEWIVTNPPYQRNLVDKIIARQIGRLETDSIDGVAILLRANFDYAKCRKLMFDEPTYYGQIKLRFRPWWTEERKAQPIHNYCWHIWKHHNNSHPVILYSDGSEPKGKINA